MSKPGPVCFIGEKEVVGPFKALGVDVYDFTPERWPDISRELLAHDYQLVFITEEVASRIPKEITANVVILPNTERMFFKTGKASLGAEELRQVIIKAVGTDILVE